MGGMVSNSLLLTQLRSLWLTIVNCELRETNKDRGKENFSMADIQINPNLYLYILLFYIMRRIILASTSSRRKELLNMLIGDNFETIPSRYEEDNTLEMEPVELVKKHSLGKGKEVAEGLSDGIVIASDCLVFLENEALGKPKDKEDARKTLRKLSGNVIEVISGIAIIDIDNNKEYTDHDSAKVKIKELTEKEIEQYIETGEPLNRAGSFAIQGKGSIFIEKIEGDYLSIVGFPIFKLNKLLNELGVSIFDYN